MKLSRHGKIVEQCWYDLPNHYGNVSLDEWVVMPNHIHGIVVFNIPDVCRDGACPVSTNTNTLGNIIGSFKSAVTKQIHKNDPNFSWQTRFYDHIIRNEQSLNRIQQYIMDNPENWYRDRNNPRFTTE